MLGVEINVVQAHVRPVLALLEEIDGLVDRNPVKPRVKAGPALEAFQRLKGLDERLLRQIVGVLVIRGHVVKRRVDALLITLHQFVVGLQIAPARGAHQIILIHRRGRLRFAAWNWFGHNHVPKY